MTHHFCVNEQTQVRNSQLRAFKVNRDHINFVVFQRPLCTVGPEIALHLLS